MNPKRLLEPGNAVMLLREPWGSVSLALNEIGQSEKWMATHSSFTAWVKSFAEAAAVQESSLWRMISAGRYYSGLGTKIGVLKLPNLVEISKKVTAEQLELVEKISRIAPPTESEQLLAGVIDGSLTRDKLRTRWRIYRDAATNTPDTAGKIKRSKAKLPLPKRRRAIPLYDSTVEKLFVTLIEKQSVKDWIGNSTPHFVKTFYRLPIALSGGDPSETSFRFHPDILVIIQEFENTPVFFHIVEVSSTHAIGTSGLELKARIAQMYADYFWLAVEDCTDDKLLRSLPSGAGLITFSSAGIKVRQRPIASGANIRSGELAKQLLTKVL